MTKKPRNPRAQGDGHPAGLSPFTDQLRAAINSSGISLYQLSRDCGVDHGQLYRFVKNERDIKLATADRIAACLRLKIVRGR